MMLAHFLAPELLYRLGWVLLHSLWQIAGVAGLLAVAMAMLRKRSAAGRYAVAWAAMAITAGAPVLTFCLLAPDAPVAAPVQANPVAPSPRQAAPRTPSVVATASPNVPAPVAANRGDPAPAPREGNLSHDRVATPGMHAAAPAPPAVPFYKRIAASLRPAMPWLVMLWLAGVVLLSMRGCLSWLATQRLRYRGASRPAASVGDILRELCDRMRLGRRLEILQSALVNVPTVIGWLAPVILLPASAISGMPAEQLRAILAHELAHIKRYDYLANLVQTVIETLLFYHPAIWWIGRRIRAEREHCCDDLALAACGHRLTYAQALYSVARIGLAHGGLAVAADGGRPGSLLARIRRIAGQPAGDADRRATWLAGTLILAGLLAGLVVYGRATAANSKATTQPATQPATAPSGALPNTDGLPRGAIVRLGTQRFRTGGKITSIAFDAEAKHVVAGGENLAILDVQTGAALLVDRGGPLDDWPVATAPDGVHSATWRHGIIYETLTGRLVALTAGRALGYGSNGESVLLSEKGYVLRLNAAGQFVQRPAVELADFPTGPAVFSPDGRFVAGFVAYGVVVCDTSTGKRIAAPKGQGDEGSIIAFSPDSRTLAFGSNPNFKGHGEPLIRLFDLTRDGAPEFAKLNVEGQIEGLAFSPDGKQLAQTGEGVRVWDIATGKKVLTLTEGARVLSAGFTKDGKRLATGDEVGIVRIYEMPAGRLIAPTDGPSEAMTGVAIVGDDKVATIDGRTVRLWELATGKPIRTLEAGGRLWGIAASPDGKLVAAVGEDKLVHAWDVATGEEKMQFMRKSLTNAATTAVAFSPDGRLLAWGHEDGAIDVLDLGPDKLIRTFAGHKRQVTCLAFSPDSKRLASSSEDNTARVWDVAEAKQLYSVEADTIRANCVAFAPIGAMLAVGDWSGTIQLFDARTGKKQSELRLTASGGENLGTLASQFALAPDGKLLACGTHSGVIAFWDVASGMELVEKRLTGHRNWTHAVAFTRDGNKLISVSSDATGLVWDLGEGATGPASRPAGKGNVHELEPRQVRVELEPADDDKPGLFAIGPCDDRGRSIKSIYQAFGKGDIKPGHYWAVGRLNGTPYDSDRFETISYQQVGNEVTARVAVVASLFGGRPNQTSSGYIYLELPQLAAGLHTVTINFVDAHKENGKLVFAPPDAPARVMPLSCTIDLRGTAKEMIETVSKPRYFPNMGGHESQVQIRMGNVCYLARKDDEKVLLEAMRNKQLDLPARLCVAGFLLDLGNEEARTFITDNLRTGDDGVVQDVGYTLFHHLGDKPDPWVVEQVVKLLKDDRARRGTIQGGVTEYICRRLAALKDQIPGAEDAIIDVLQRNHACGGAAEALGAIGDARAIKALLETAEDNGKLNYQQAIALVKLKRLELTPILLAHLDDEVALDLLGDLKDPTSLGPIQKRLLEHQYDEQAFALTLAWTRVRATSSRDLARRLLETLANEKPRNQSRLLGELGKTREPMCIKPIVELARTSENTSVLMNCIFALRKIDGPEVVAGLVDLLDRDFVEQPNPRGKPSRQFRLREWVSEALKQKTGRAFGEDPAKWREWLKTQQPAPVTAPASRPVAAKAKLIELDPRVELEPADDGKPGLFAIGPCEISGRSIKSIYQAFGKGDIEKGHYWAVGRLNGALFDNDKFETISCQRDGNEMAAKVAVVASPVDGRPNLRSSGYIILDLPYLAADLYTLKISFVDAHRENGKLVFAPPDALPRVRPLSCTIDLRGTAKEMIETAAKGIYNANSNGNGVLVSQVHRRMNRLRYRAQKGDEKALLEAMRNKELDLPARLCVAGFLLDLGNEEARRFITDNRRTGDDAVVQDVGYALLHHLNDEPDPWVVEQVMQLIRDSEARGVREVADDLCRRLGALNDRIPSAETAIIDVLTRSHDCYGAAEALGEIGDARAVKALLETIEDSGKLNEPPATALVKLKRVEVTPILLAHLDDRMAIELLGELRDPTAIGPLQRYLEGHLADDHVLDLRIALAILRAKDTKDLATQLVAMLPGEKDGQRRVLGELGKTGEPLYAKAVLDLARTSEDIGVLMDCIFALRNIDGPEVVAGLVDLLDRDFVEKLDPRMKPPSRQFRLREWVSDTLKYKTGRALGEDPAKWREWLQTQPAAAPATMPATAPSGAADHAKFDGLVKELAATRPIFNDGGNSPWSRLLNQIGKELDGEPEARLIELLSHENAQVRWLSAIRLGKLKSQAAVPQLLAMLADRESEPRIGATWALGEIQDPRAAEEFIRIVEFKSTLGNRRGAIEALGKIATPRAIEALQSVTPDEVDYDAAETALAEAARRRPDLTKLTAAPVARPGPDLKADRQKLFADVRDFVARQSPEAKVMDHQDGSLAIWVKPGAQSGRAELRLWLHAEPAEVTRHLPHVAIFPTSSWYTLELAAPEKRRWLTVVADVSHQGPPDSFLMGLHGMLAAHGYKGPIDPTTPAGEAANRAAYGQAANGLRLGLAAGTKDGPPTPVEMPATGAVTVQVSLQSTLDKPLMIRSHRMNIYDYCPATTFEVTAPGGKTYVLGKPVTLMDEADMPRPVELGAGQTYVQVIDLSDWKTADQKTSGAEVFKQPGEYTVKCIYKLEKNEALPAQWSGQVVSAPVTVKLVGGNAKTSSDKSPATHPAVRFGPPEGRQPAASPDRDEKWNWPTANPTWPPVDKRFEQKRPDELIPYVLGEKHTEKGGPEEPALACAWFITKLQRGEAAEPLRAELVKQIVALLDRVAADRTKSLHDYAIQAGCLAPLGAKKEARRLLGQCASLDCCYGPALVRGLGENGDLSDCGALIDAIGKETEGSAGCINEAMEKLTGLKKPLLANHQTDQPAWRAWWDERPAAKVVTRGEAVAAAVGILAKSDFTRFRINEAQFHPLAVATHYDPAQKTAVGRAESYQKEQARDVWVVNFSGLSGNSSFQSWLLIEGGSGQQLAPGRMVQVVKDVTPEQLPAAMNRYKLVTPTIEYERRTFYLCYDGNKLPAGVKVGFTLDADNKRQTWLLRMAEGKVAQAIAAPVERVFVADVTGDGRPNIVLASSGEQADPALKMPTFDAFPSIDYSDGDMTIGEGGTGMYSRETRVFRAGDKLEELFSAPGGHGVSGIGTHTDVWADLYGNGTPVLCQVVTYGDFHLKHAKPEFSQELAGYWAKDAAGKWQQVQVGKPIPTHQGAVDFAKLKGLIAAPATRPATAPAAKGAAGEEKPIAWGKAVEGLQAGLRVPRLSEASCAVGESASLEVVVRNTSDKAVHLTTFHPSFLAPTVHDPNGAAVRVSQPAFDGPVQAREHQLAPGATEVLDAMRCAFAPGTGLDAAGGNIVHASPGVYKIRCTLRLTKHRDGDFDGELTTGDLDFTVLEPDVKALTKRVAERLKGDMGTFVLKVVYLGDKERGFRSLRLIAGDSKEQFPPDWATVRIDQKQAGAMIDYLGTAGYLARWITDSYPEAAFNAPCYFLAIETGERSTGFTIPLGWGAPMQAKLAELRKAMEGEAGRGMDGVLGQLEPMKGKP